jgi:hypothetical protein
MARDEEVARECAASSEPSEDNVPAVVREVVAVEDTVASEQKVVTVEESERELQTTPVDPVDTANADESRPVMPTTESSSADTDATPEVEGETKCPQPTWGTILLFVLKLCLFWYVNPLLNKVNEWLERKYKRLFELHSRLPQQESQPDQQPTQHSQPQQPHHSPLPPPLSPPLFRSTASPLPTRLPQRRIGSQYSTRYQQFGQRKFVSFNDDCYYHSKYE